MNNYEICEKLVEKTGVSFSQAKDALERSDWDLLDAVVLLESEGAIPAAGGSCSGSEKTVASSDPGCERGNYDARTEEYYKQMADRRREKEYRRAKTKAECRSFFGRIGAFLTDNRLLAYNNVGKEVLNVPVWMALVVFCCTFWITIFLILFSFYKGWQYRFLGPDLGKDAVNKASDAVGDAVHKAGCDLKNSWDRHRSERNGYYNTDCTGSQEDGADREVVDLDKEN